MNAGFKIFHVVPISFKKGLSQRSPTNFSFCPESAHRYSDRHDCSYDYNAAGREAIARENLVVRAAKIQNDIIPSINQSVCKHLVTAMRGCLHCHVFYVICHSIK